MSSSKKRKIIKTLLRIAFIIFCVLCVFYFFGVTAHAAGFLDETVNETHSFSKYSEWNYQLDYHADKNSWWDVGGNIANGALFILHLLINVIWLLSVLLSSITGFLVQEAFNLDLIGSMADKLGKNIQNIAGINRSGFDSNGFLPQILKFLILILGLYMLYMGAVKKTASKAVGALVNFAAVLLIGGSMIAFAPDIITAVNDFSVDLSDTALEVTSSMLGVETETQDGENEDENKNLNLIRSNMFDIQVQKPWLILQYGDSNIENIGEERVRELLSKAPMTKEREAIATKEVQDGNLNMSPSNLVMRLVMVIVLLVFNLIISFFIIMLAGTMLFSQVLFMVYAMVLPLSCIVSMIPGQANSWKKSAVKMFNTLLMKFGITIVITIAFSLSSSAYEIAAELPFVFVMFIQIIVFAGIHMKLGDIMGMFGLNISDSKGLAGGIMHKGSHMVKRQLHKISHLRRHSQRNRKPKQTKNFQNSPSNFNRTSSRTPMSEKIGSFAANVADVPSKIKDKASSFKNTVSNAPLNVRYAAHNAKENISQGVNHVALSAQETKRQNLINRKQKQVDYQNKVNRQKSELSNSKQGQSKTTRKPISNYSMTSEKPLQDTPIKNKDSERKPISDLSTPKNQVKNNVVGGKPQKRQPIHQEPPSVISAIERENQLHSQTISSLKPDKTLNRNRSNLTGKVRREPKVRGQNVR